jgi:hypothetical protein
MCAITKLPENFRTGECEHAFNFILILHATAAAARITHLTGSGAVAELYLYEVLRLQTINKVFSSSMLGISFGLLPHTNTQATSISEAPQYGVREFFGVIIMYVCCIVLVFLFRVSKVVRKYFSYKRERRRTEALANARNKVKAMSNFTRLFKNDVAPVLKADLTSEQTDNGSSSSSIEAIVPIQPPDFQ